MVLIHLRRVNATRTVNTTCVAGKTQITLLPRVPLSYRERRTLPRFQAS